ncbi:MAG: LysM peptidoglycan-binding domain-containing protein [Anaerolineae bacterium]|nr:LysM peptidoglycan-binding domain-containing protein [Anaerolineae bacterium]
MDADLDFLDDEAGMEEEEDGQPPKRRSPLRIILLMLLVLVLLCVVCYAGTNLLGGTLAGILPAQVQSFLPGGGEQAPTVIPIVETEEPIPVTTEELPPVATGEPAPTEEPPPVTEEAPIPGEPAPTEEPVPPTEELVPPVEETAPPTEELVSPTEELAPPVEETAPPTEEPGELTPTTEPVPGPTSTPTREGGPIVVTPVSCDNNQPPVAKANGPYQAMMGKGQAWVTFNATGSEDPDGTIIKYEWEFGDGSTPGTGESVTHGYTNIGNYVAILTITDDCNAVGQDTAEVTIVGPTPPSPNHTPTPTPTGSPPPAETTLGFCYLVQYGDTLSGIAWYYGIPLYDLAAVNGVSPDYFVIAGQGLFIPMSEITDGPNAYQAQAGDTLAIIAYQCGLTITALAQANDLEPNAAVSPGQTIIIPLGR